MNKNCDEAVIHNWIAKIIGEPWLFDYVYDFNRNCGVYYLEMLEGFRVVSCTGKIKQPSLFEILDYREVPNILRQRCSNFGNTLGQQLTYKAQYLKVFEGVASIEVCERREQCEEIYNGYRKRQITRQVFSVAIRDTDQRKPEVNLHIEGWNSKFMGILRNHSLWCRVDTESYTPSLSVVAVTTKDYLVNLARSGAMNSQEVERLT